MYAFLYVHFYMCISSLCVICSYYVCIIGALGLTLWNWSVCCVCVCCLLLFSSVLHRMCSVVSFVIPILETLAARFALPALLYLCEVAEDGLVLAGVELELPADGTGAMAERRFFWCEAWVECLNAYDQAALEAIRFLQGVYGFVVCDYNYDYMLAYRESVRSAVLVAR
uniref:Uncharacterized protein n=1 Tax=Avena sativa TaxID=4498 RepID=A0ACD5YGB5_AVESA